MKTNTAKDTRDLLQIMRKYDIRQINEVFQGFQQGLTQEEVKLYADSKFKWEQMKQIRHGFENGLIEEQVRLYADPKFRWFQMYLIRTGFEYGLTMEQVRLYAKPEFSDRRMQEICQGLIRNELQCDSSGERTDAEPDPEK